MYCHHCGKEVFGNYCSNCGTQVMGANLSHTGTSWDTESDFDKLIHYPAVRKIISKYADESPKRTSAKAFLKLVDTAIAPIAGLSTETLAEIVVPIYEKIGISTGKSEMRQYHQSIQKVIVKSFCSLAKNGYPLDTYKKANNGIVLTATIPSDLWTWGGNIIISIEEFPSFTQVNIATKIKGQFYDWGKSKKLINKFLLDIDQIHLDF